MYIYDNISLNFFRLTNVADKIVQKLEKHFVYSRNFCRNVSGMRICRKVWYNWTGHRWQYNEAHALCM